MRSDTIKYHFAGLEFSPGEYKLKTLKGKSIALTGKPFCLLRVFVENYGSVLSVDDLIREVWSDEIESIENDTVTHQISALRSSLKKVSKANLIVNVRRKGYTLAAKVTIEESMDSKAVVVINHHQASEYAGIRQELAEIKSALNFLRMDFNSMKTEIAILRNLLSRLMYASSDIERARLIFDTVQWLSKRLDGAERESNVNTLASIDDLIVWALDYFSRTAPIKELELAALLTKYWFSQGRWAYGVERLQNSLSRQQAESDIQAFALAWLSHLAYSIDDYNLAEQSASKSIRLSKSIGDEQSLALALYNQAAIATAKANYQRARSLLNECMQVSQSARIEWMPSWVYNKVGQIRMAEEFFSQAEHSFFQSLELRQGVDSIAYIQTSLAAASLAQGKIEQAKLWTDKSFASLNKEVLACAYTNLGMLDLTTGHYKPAYDNFQKAFSLHQQISDKRGMARASECMARCKEAMGVDKEAARLYGSAFSIRKAIAAPLSPAERKAYGASIEVAKKRDFAEFQAGSQSIIKS